MSLHSRVRDASFSLNRSSGSLPTADARRTRKCRSIPGSIRWRACQAGEMVLAIWPKGRCSRRIAVGAHDRSRSSRSPQYAETSRRDDEGDSRSNTKGQTGRRSPIDARRIASRDRAHVRREGAADPCEWLWQCVVSRNVVEERVHDSERAFESSRIQVAHGATSRRFAIGSRWTIRHTANS